MFVANAKKILPSVGLALVVGALGSACNTDGSDSSIDQPISGTLTIGSPCLLDRECASGFCIPEEFGDQATGWREGACSAICGGTTGCVTSATCVGLVDASYCLPRCAVAGDDCREGYVCHPTFEACLPDCRQGWDCGALLRCDQTDGICRSAEDASDSGSGLGAACSGPATCDSGLCLAEQLDGVDTGWVDGMCSEACNPAGGCGGGGACIRLDGQLFCVPSCATNDDCRTGYVCSPHVGGCLPDCRLGWDCGDGFDCSATDGLCSLPPSDAAGVGDGCEKDVDCASGICFPEQVDGTSTTWADGACVGICSSAACGDGTVCVVLDGYSWCVAACDAEHSCRTGYACSDTFGGCLPDCRLGWDCGSGFECASDGQCNPVVPLAEVGDACSVDSDCTSGICFEELVEGDATSWTDGTCAGICGSPVCGDQTECAVLDGGAYCLVSCSAEKPCLRAGYVCSDSLCVCLPDCTLGWDCGSGFECGVDGQCRPVVPLAEVGDACSVDSDCTSGICFEELVEGNATSWTDGTCAGICGTQICGADTACIVLDGRSYCLASCTSGCREGYVCSVEATVCLPDCRLGWDCGDGFECASDGQCKPAGSTLAPLGASCAVNADCDSGLCLLENPETSSSWTYPICTALCAATNCPSSTDCVALGSVSYCLPSCQGGVVDDCPSGYVCDGTAHVCLPSCLLGWTCPDGTECHSLGLCRTRGI